MTTPTRLAEIAERHEKTTLGEWTAAAPIKGWIDIKATPTGPLSQPSSAYGVACVRPGRKTQADADFIAHAHQDVPWMHAQLTAAQARSREDAEIMREVIAEIEANPPNIGAPLVLLSRLRARADELEGRTDG